MSRVLPSKEPEGERANTGVSLPKRLLEKLQQVADEENYSRNEVIVHFLRWALLEHEREKREEQETEHKRRK